MILFTFLFFAILIILYFGFGKKLGLEWDFAEFLLIFPMFPFLPYVLLIFAYMLGSKSE